MKVDVADGKTGATREIQYNNLKVIGNGSFGVVFQATLLDTPAEEASIAIKKVLQDKRFKASHFPSYVRRARLIDARDRTVSCRSCVSSSIPMS